MSIIPVPKKTWRRHFQNTSLYDILLALLTLSGGIVAAILLVNDADPGKRRGGWIALGIAVAVATVNIVKAVTLWREKSVKESPDAIEGCLHTLLEVLKPGGSAPNNPDGLRATVHVHLGEGSQEKLIQVLNYIGDQRKLNTVGRRIPVHCGVTGKAFRLKSTVTYSRTSAKNDDHIKDLVTGQGYTDAEARALDSSAWEFCAIPITDSAVEIIGILYLDAKTQGFFTNEITALAQRASTGIASYVGKRYCK